MEDALNLASKQELDLVEFNVSSNISICKILNYEKMLYELKKNKKTNKEIKTKEIRFSYKIADGDILIKSNYITKLLKSGNRVKISIIYKGREMVFINNGKDTINRILAIISQTYTYKIITNAKITGNNYNIIIE